MQYMNSNEGFLGIENCKIEKTNEIIIPFGLESTVSYGLGTSKGPEEIIKASHQLELYDEDLDYEPYRRIGIRTKRIKKIEKNNHKALTQLEKVVAEVLRIKKFPLVLGGEHSVTIGSIRPFAENFKNITIVHFDAHSDLRNTYKGDKFSHACTIRRCLDYENISVVSIGIRSISNEELIFVKKNKNRISIFWGKDKKDWDLKKIKRLIKNKNVYITFDMDSFDSSLMPATGTPEPGGLFWDHAINLLKMVCMNSNVLGADVNELAPIKGINSYNFLAAKFCYKILSYIFHYKKS